MARTRCHSRTSAAKSQLRKVDRQRKKLELRYRIVSRGDQKGEFWALLDCVNGGKQACLGDVLANPCSQVTKVRLRLVQVWTICVPMGPHT